MTYIQANKKNRHDPFIDDEMTVFGALSYFGVDAVRKVKRYLTAKAADRYSIVVGFIPTSEVSAAREDLARDGEAELHFGIDLMRDIGDGANGIFTVHLALKNDGVICDCNIGTT